MTSVRAEGDRRREPHCREALDRLHPLDVGLAREVPAGPLEPLDGKDHPGGAGERFARATEIDPTYAAAWNNLGIGFEQQGRFDEARKAYERALELDPDNTYFRNNYDLFREIYDRQNRRRGR